MVSKSELVFNDTHQLSPLQSSFNKHELEYFWPEFEAKLPELFVTDTTDCKVEIVEVTPPLNYSSSWQSLAGECSEFDDKENLIECISAKELDTALHVRCVVSKLTFKSFLTN